MIHYKTGDILDATENIIVQQVNHKKVMGAGLALQIRNKYPGIYDAYCKFCDNYSFEMIKNIGIVCMYNTKENSKWIACVWGQDGFGIGGVYTDYDALKSGLMTVCYYAKMDDLSVAIPYGIGCGLAGGDWNVVKEIIESVFYDYEATIYKLK